MSEGERSQGWHERFPLAETPLWRPLAISAAIVGVAFVLRLALKHTLPVGSPFITFFPAVLLIAFLCGARIGAAAALVSTLLGAWFFMSDPMAPGYFNTAVPSAVLYGIMASLNIGLLHWMQTANARLRVERQRSAALATTREMLFRELQHRVSNNLQVAAGLLSLQKRHVDSDRAKAALEEAARRIAVIGRISRQLYEPDGGTRTLRALIEPMCKDVLDAGGITGVDLKVIGGDDQSLPSDAAIPVALIVAEAVANAIEHGFAGRGHGTIAIHCMGGAKTGTRIEIRDDGKGLPEGFAIEKHAGLGLRIAATLAEQLGGTFELTPRRAEDGGVIGRLVIPG